MNAIDLFCGCGGMSRGLVDAGINIVAGIDIWDKAVNNYNKNSIIYFIFFFTHEKSFFIKFFFHTIQKILF